MQGRIGNAGSNPEELLTTTEVAQRFRVNAKTVRRWARAGKITARMTPGGQRRFSANEINALLRDSTTAAVSNESEHGAGTADPADSPWLPRGNGRDSNA